MDMIRADRIRGGLWGLLIGDALGVPYEFHPPSGIPSAVLIEMTPPAGFRAAHGVPPGTWSDDGAQALCLASTLVARGEFDVEAFGACLRDWARDGWLAVDGHVFDIGNATATAIRRLTTGISARMSGCTEESSNGNGSLMRVLPLALAATGTDEELVEDAQLQSAVTHAHPLSKACCALYCLAARAIIEGQAKPWCSAVERLRAIRPAALALIEAVPRAAPAGTGFVVDSLRFAELALGAGWSYERTAREAIQLGHDTDTTAAIACGLVGARDGAAAIPERWMAALRAKEVAGPVIEELVKMRAAALDITSSLDDSSEVT